MNRGAPGPLGLERLLARMLHHGTWVASAVIVVGLGVASLGSNAASPDLRIATVGIAIFIALPVFRVGLMLAVFLRERDYRYGIVAGLVLVILLVGFAVGWMGKFHG